MKYPDAIIACVGGGSNAMGIFYPFLEESNVELIGVEAAGSGLMSGKHAAPLNDGEPGILQETGINSRCRCGHNNKWQDIFIQACIFSPRLTNPTSRPLMRKTHPTVPRVSPSWPWTVPGPRPSGGGIRACPSPGPPLASGDTFVTSHPFIHPHHHPSIIYIYKHL